MIDETINQLFNQSEMIGETINQLFNQSPFDRSRCFKIDLRIKTVVQYTKGLLIVAIINDLKIDL